MSITSTSALVLPEGCSCWTHGSIQDLTPTIFENQGNTAYGANRIYLNAARSKMVGVMPTTMETFLMGRITDVKDKLSTVNIGGDRFINLPYLVRRRDHQISNEYFQVTAGTSNSNTTTNGEWELTIEVINDDILDALNGSPIFNQFLVGQYLYIQYSDSAGDAGEQATINKAFKVVSSVAGSTASEATVTVVPNYTPAGYQALTAAEKTLLAPTGGIVTTGTNNVDDYEQYCDVESVEIAPEYKIDYAQTSRNAFCYTKEFLEMDKLVQEGKVNDYYKTFQYLPVTQRNRMIQKKYRDKWMHSIFYNEPFSENQSPNIYVPGSTPIELTVVDPTDTSCVLGYKANALGIRTLLGNAGQVIDMTGAALDLRVVLDGCYAVKRNREIDGGSVDRISAIGSRQVYNGVVTALINYIKAKYGVDSLDSKMENGTLQDKFGNVRLNYTKFELPEWGFEFVISHDNFFTDQERMAITSGQTTHAGKLYIMDWADLEIGILETNSQKIDENDSIAAKVVDELKCTISQNTIHRTLESTTWTVRIGNEKRSMIVEGFDPTQDVTTA